MEWGGHYLWEKIATLPYQVSSDTPQWEEVGRIAEQWEEKGLSLTCPSSPLGLHRFYMDGALGQFITILQSKDKVPTWFHG
jgi:hypothetical protein